MGIGKKISSKFQEKGFKVIGIDKKKSISCDNFFKFDFENIDQKEKTNQLFLKIDEILSGGTLSAVINNAACQVKKPLEKLQLTDFNKSLKINFLSPFLIGKYFSKHLTKSKGVLINILSIHTDLSKKEFGAYASSKNALLSITKTFAIEFGSKFITVGISPGAIETEMLKEGFLGNEDKYSELKNFQPTKKIGKPEDIAELAFFLVSQRIGFLNGSIIDISGGIKNCLKDPS